MEKHYEEARVEGERTEKGITLKTKNVRALTMPNVPAVIDGQKVPPLENVLHTARFRKVDGKWSSSTELEKGYKSPGLQGPIDDAFTTPFLCVRGTGKPWDADVQAHADASLERFRQEWSKYFRGDLRIKDDRDVTEADIQHCALILFGDPGSNSLVAQAMPKLPFSWTRKG